jgi:RND family efflux transporter MFP subunit
MPLRKSRRIRILKKEKKLFQAPLIKAMLPSIAALVFLWGCTSDTSVDEVDFLVPVGVSDVGTADVEDRIVATGTLRVSEMAYLEVETGGVIEFAKNSRGRRFSEGDRVKAGEVIARITGEDIRLSAGTEASRQRFEKAKEDYEATKKLFDEGFKSKADLLADQSSLEEARQTYEKSLNLESRSVLTTPIDGVILSLARKSESESQPIADGQIVNAGFEVARIAPTERLIADVDLVGQDVARVAVGLPGRVRHYAWDDQYFQGEVLRLAPTIDATTRALRVEVEVDNPENLLRPGMFVEVTLVKELRKAVTVVPREAVTDRGGKWVVFVLKGQRVAMKEVVLGLGDDDIVEIREGLEGGGRVVVQGLETLTDQTRVRITG